MKVAIIGGGAAGCFAAIELRRQLKNVDVTVIEAGRRLLAKVAITGGGRCNLTNSFANIKSLSEVYPRGERLMKRLLKEFSHEDVQKWFESEGVRLVTQTDDCVFPASQDAMEIVRTLTAAMRREGVNVLTSTRVEKIMPHCTIESNLKTELSQGFDIVCSGGATIHCDIVIVATGGSPLRTGMSFLDDLALDIVEPVPSLFSLCIDDEGIRNLTGTVVDASVSITGTKLRSHGALLLTHWGMSGPAILRLSSYAARYLHEKDYLARLSVNWLGGMNEEEALLTIGSLAAENRHKLLASAYPEQLNSRLWAHLLSRASLRHDQRWGELGRKSIARLTSTLTNDTYPIAGKNKYKDEFVTCGGVALGNINANTLECRTVPGLFFAGEVTDVDAITGGFNLQAAWTMGYVAAQGVAEKIKRQEFVANEEKE